jgi:hypothetical protein
LHFVDPVRSVNLFPHSRRKPPEAWFKSASRQQLHAGKMRTLNIDILEESGFCRISQFGIVNLMDAPDGLNAKELERYLREHG